MVLEILISTMHRKDLFFLNKMFVNDTITDFQILIINQTTKEHILTSEFSNIRVINSFEKGLSKSRNLAIENALGDICLIADDDVEYVKGFDKNIKEAYADFIDVNSIVFNSNVYGYDKNPKYLNASKKIYNIKECGGVCSVEISFKRKPIQSNNIKFNELMGLNSAFMAGEEWVFLNDIFVKLSNLYYKDSVILNHKTISTGTRLSLMQSVSIYAVQYYLVYPRWFALKVIKFMIFMLVHKKMKTSDSLVVYKTFFESRKKYIKLKAESKSYL